MILIIVNKDEATFEKFIDLLCEEFDVEREEISYTLSVKPEEKEFSYHISIPSIQLTPEELHSMFFTKAVFNDFNAGPTSPPASHAKYA